jgi:hypothetical protein
MYQKAIPEVLRLANEIEDPEERAKFLRIHMREPLFKVLACFHNEAIEFDRFKDVKYTTKHNKAGISDSTLDHEMKRIYIFTKDNALPTERKRQKLIQILESMYAEESDLVYNHLIQKKNPYKNLNKNFIKKYFPQVLTYSLDRK